MAINLVPLRIALSSACAALTLGTLPASAAAPPASGQGSTGEWRYEIDSSSITRSLNAWAASGGMLETPLGTARLQQLSAEIDDQELIVRGVANTGWFSVPVDAAATASIQSGTVQVHVVDAHFNGVDVPAAARGQLEQQVQTQLAQSIAGTGVGVHSVALGDGKLRLTLVGP